MSYTCNGTIEFRWECYPDEPFPVRTLHQWETLLEIMCRNQYLSPIEVELTDSFLRIKTGSQLRIHKPEKSMYSIIGDGLSPLLYYAASFWMDLKLVYVKWDDTEMEYERYRWKTLFGASLDD